MEALTLILVFTLIIIMIVLWTRRPKNFPPGPPSYPLIGSLPALAMVQEDTNHDTLWALSKMHGPVMGIFIGTQPTVVVCGYNAIKEVLSRDDFAFRPNIIPVAMKSFGRRIGVFFTDGEMWKEQRRFTLRNLRDFGFGKRTMEALIHEEARSLIEIMETMASESKNGVDLLSLLPVVTINVLWTIMAGKRHEINDKDFRKLTEAVITFFREGNVFSPVNFSKLLQKIPIINASYARQLVAADEVKHLVQQTINDHLATFDESHMRDFMDVYIKEMKSAATDDSSFSSDQLCALCIDLFNAGTETTASTIGYALRYLLQYPSAQKELRDEIHRVVGTGRLPSMDDISNLPYTQAFIAETLRHSGLAPFTLPHATGDETELLGYTVPKGCSIMVNLWTIHMDPTYWGDPENFRPERFITTNGQFQKNDHLLAFGTGSRMCLGEPLARYTTHLFLMALVQNFTFEPVGSPPTNKQMPGFTTSPAHFRINYSRL